MKKPLIMLRVMRGRMEFKTGKRLNAAVIEHRKTCKAYGKETDLFEWRFIPYKNMKEFTTEIQVAKCMICKKELAELEFIPSQEEE